MLFSKNAFASVDIIYKYEHDNKKCKTCGIENFDENWKKRFANTSKLSNDKMNKFILLLQKGVYPCKFIDY